MHNHHKYLCWLHQIRDLGRSSVYALLETASEANLFRECTKQDYRECARILYRAPEQELRYICGEAFSTKKAGEKVLRILLDARKQNPAEIEENLARTDIAFSCILEEGFPDRLRHIPDPPFGIYSRGRYALSHRENNSENAERRICASGAAEAEELFKSPAAAVIGARSASPYGKEQARRFAGRLAMRGITIVSGMARGIDGIAQRAALDAGGKSIAVLGCGVDICYPEENRDLYDRLLQEGMVLSEYPPGMQPLPRLFPPRNRLISGLSDLVFVVEARKKSGTLITVDMALEQGREVFALPGRVGDALSDGCNRLIRQGAGIASSPEDLLEFYFGANGPGRADSGPENCKTADFISINGKREHDVQTNPGPAGGRHAESADQALFSENQEDFSHAGQKKENDRKNGFADCSTGHAAAEDPPEGIDLQKREGGVFERATDGEKWNKSGSVQVLSRVRSGSFGCGEDPVQEDGGKADRENEGCRRSALYDPEETFPVRESSACGVEAADEEEAAEEKPFSLEELILHILSSGDEMHIERILEEIGYYVREGRTMFTEYDFPAVNACLLKLKIDNRAEEELTGYYRKTGEW